LPPEDLQAVVKSELIQAFSHQPLVTYLKDWRRAKDRSTVFSANRQERTGFHPSVFCQQGL